MPRIAIVAALEREVRPLIRNWQARWIEHDGRKFRVFEKGEASLICGGIGPEAARRATEAVIQHSAPIGVLSVGFAGALDPSLAAGEVIEPRTVINAGDGSRTETAAGAGMLVSFGAVADGEQKRKLRDAYGALAVDMEAGAVAQGAATRGLRFSALKVISDTADSTLPPVEKFVGRDGKFRSAAFGVYVALRPWLWRSTSALARNSVKASRALCAALDQYLQSATVEVLSQH
jgi:adenosylhomocysteine nucleosidase